MFGWTDGKNSDGRKIFGRRVGIFSDLDLNLDLDLDLDPNLDLDLDLDLDLAKILKIRSWSQMKVQVMRIRNLAESSKSELSSRGRRPFKVYSLLPLRAQTK